MIKTELNAFRRALEARQIELAGESKQREALAVETSADELDRIQHTQDRDWAMGNLERSSTALREVRAALRRMDAGTFGICLDCEEDINPKRLVAVPWASFCIVCQEAADCAQRAPWNEVETSLVIAA